MIGNAEDAALALTRPSWAYMDEGSERICYLINDVVYKVQFRYGNVEELDSYDYLCRQVFPSNITIAQLTPWYIKDTVVIAAEYVKGQCVSECYDAMLGLPCSEPGTCLDEATADSIRNLGIMDLSYGNVILRDNTYVIVDMEG